MGTIEHKNQGLIDKLVDLRDLARTGLPTHGMTSEQWANYKCGRIARELDLIVHQLEDAQSLDLMVHCFEQDND